MGAGGNLGTIGIQLAKNVIGAKVIAAAGLRRSRQARARSRRRSRRQLQHAGHRRRGDEVHRRQGRQRALRQHRQFQGAAAGVPRARHERPPGHRRRAWRAERDDRLLAPLSQEDHHHGPHRPHGDRHPEMLRGRGARASSRRRSRACCRSRAPPRRIGWSNRARCRARSCSTRRWISATHSRHSGVRAAHPVRPCAARSHDRNFRPLRPWGSAYIPATSSHRR